jgi:membrane-associated phospholipid phosphatase
MIRMTAFSRNNLSMRIADFISLILDPRVLYIPVVIALGMQGSDAPLRSLGWAVGVILMSALPLALIILIQSRRAVYADRQVPERKDRGILFVIGIGCITLSLLVLICFSGPGNLIKLLAAMLLTGSIGGVINRKIKLSVHTGACAGAVTSIVACFGLKWLPVVLLVPLVGWSRIALHRHTIGEILIGGIVGFGCTTVTFWFLNSLIALTV